MNTEMIAAFKRGLEANLVDRCVLVTSSFRSGSSLICSMLAANGLHGIRSEKFAGFWKFQEPFDTSLFEEEIKTISDNPPKSGVFVSKIMWPHRNMLATCVGSTRKDANLFSQIFPNAKWVNISRQDKIGQAISFWRAKKTNQWSTANNDNSNSVISLQLSSDDYDFEGIRSCYVELSAHEMLWDDFHARAGTDVLKIQYEEFLRDTKGSLDRLQDFLIGHGINDGEMRAETHYKKQRDDLTVYFRERFLFDLYQTNF